MTELAEDQIKPEAHLSISLTSPNPKISLSSTLPSNTLTLIVTARITSSTRPTSPITICTNGSVLDNGQHERHDGIFIGAFQALQSLTDPHRYIPLAVLRGPSYGSVRDASENLRERPWMRFETVPAVGNGELVIKHELTLDRIFRYWRRPIDCVVQPGEKYRLRMNPKRLLWSGWWHFGALDDEGEGGLGGKKFLKWERPDEKGEIENLVPGERSPDVELLEREGWVFSERFYDVEATEEGTGDGIVIEFTE